MGMSFGQEIMLIQSVTKKKDNNSVIKNNFEIMMIHNQFDRYIYIYIDTNKDIHTFYF